MTLPTLHTRFTGCLLGSALGDALGAPFEGGWTERAVWHLLARTRTGLIRYTDDTQMSRDLANSLLACDGWKPDHATKLFAKNYRWSRGYGPGTAKMLRRIRSGDSWENARFFAYPQGSWGNGGAMRAHIAALWCYGTADKAMELARAQASVTHAHPLGQDGAALIAAATINALTRSDTGFNKSIWLSHTVQLAALREGEQWHDSLEKVQHWLVNRIHPMPSQVAHTLGNDISAKASCVSAIYVALHFIDSDFVHMLRFVQRMGGDVDTISAMAGAIYGAMRGASVLPVDAISRLEDAPSLNVLAKQLAQRVTAPELDQLTFNARQSM